MVRRATSSVETTIEVERENDDETCFLYELTVECRYNPGRPPPPCSDHDHPNFSDPGDPAECEIEKITIEHCYDEEGEEVPESDPRRLKPEKLELTDSEQEHLEGEIASRYDYDDGPDPDEAYERWRDRQED